MKGDQEEKPRKDVLASTRKESELKELLFCIWREVPGGRSPRGSNYGFCTWTRSQGEGEMKSGCVRLQ